MSFDLVVFTLEAGASAADIRAAHELCRQGEHADGAPGPRITSFYRAVTADYPDRPAGPGSPWQVSPLHVAADHLEMRLTESCADEVLLTIERLAGEHGLLLFDPQDGSVYPPPTPLPPLPPPPPPPVMPPASGRAPVARGSASVARGSAPVPPAPRRATR